MAIRSRRSAFGELIPRVEAGDVGWEHFAPIIQSLLPMADPELRAAIQKEMDDDAFWRKVKAVVVGILSVAVLIATIFPPTSALGFGVLTATEVGLGGYAMYEAPGMIATGQAYSLGTGANDVFSPEQQAAGSAMVLAGFISLVAGPLQVAGGIGRMQAAADGWGLPAR
ncbi:hypothetical protein [Paracraurococcus lichenis]|uniref:Uncharacterized protein n=1 Tax=Paracraurococcus lichenis TaxID=3064888 RepID=A0ABT9E9M4_9PROT|nr:hypothetical protein [Paracraurococcus sp. LOR1-02]MDO9712888.1 hypothetical protein [Paracraurococcus sp. LOR1-02]